MNSNELLPLLTFRYEKHSGSLHSASSEIARGLSMQCYGQYKQNSMATQRQLSRAAAFSSVCGCGLIQTLERAIVLVDLHAKRRARGIDVEGYK